MLIFRKILILFFIANAAQAQETWNSSDGLKHLNHSQFKNDFYQLANFYQAQINPFYCSAASSVTILNAINHANIYKQEDFFSEKTDKIKAKAIILNQQKNDEDVNDPGLTLTQLSRVLSEVYNLKTTIIYAENFDKKSLNNFRKTVMKITRDNDKFLLVNFDGKILGNKTNGHISPLVAYDKSSDLVLIMDVALHKNQWFWTPLEKLYQAMNSKDGEQYRGFLIIEK
jgi:hypothetical protein